jgi:pre-mRNA-splicing factor ATP-dependent RNA helicase DHX16
MAEFPSDPMVSRTILAAEELGCLGPVLSICAMLDVQGAVFFRPRDKAQEADARRRAFTRGGSVAGVGDHFVLLRVYEAWEEAGYSPHWCDQSFVQMRSMGRARNIRRQLLALCERMGVDVDAASANAASPHAIGKALTRGFFFHAAHLDKGGTYRTFGRDARSVKVHPSSCLYRSDAPPDKRKQTHPQHGTAPHVVEEPPPPFVIFHELVRTSDEFMREVSEIQPEWLLEAAPHLFHAKDFADHKGRIPQHIAHLAAAAAEAAHASTLQRTGKPDSVWETD